MGININQRGVKEQEKRSFETYMYIFGGPVFFSALLTLGWLALHSDKYQYTERTIYILFNLLGLLALILFFVYCIFVPVKEAVRFNKVIKTLIINEDKLTGATCNVAWFSSKNFEKSTRNIEISKIVEINYGNGIKQGLLIRSGEKDFYLIKDFVDDFDSLNVKLEKN